MKWALVDSENIVQNLIVYNGEALYTPPDELVLQQVGDWISIGDNTDTPNPHPEE